MRASFYLWFSLCMSLYLSVSVPVSLCVCVHSSVNTVTLVSWCTRQLFNVCPHHPSPLWQGFSSLGNLPPTLLHLAIRNMGLWTSAVVPVFSWGLNSGPHACMASAFPTEPSSPVPVVGSFIIWGADSSVGCLGLCPEEHQGLLSIGAHLLSRKVAYYLHLSFNLAVRV